MRKKKCEWIVTVSQKGGSDSWATYWRYEVQRVDAADTETPLRSNYDYWWAWSARLAAKFRVGDIETALTRKGTPKKITTTYKVKCKR